MVIFVGFIGSDWGHFTVSIAVYSTEKPTSWHWTQLHARPGFWSERCRRTWQSTKEVFRVMGRRERKTNLPVLELRATVITTFRALALRLSLRWRANARNISYPFLLRRSIILTAQCFTTHANAVRLVLSELVQYSSSVLGLSYPYNFY